MYEIAGETPAGAEIGFAAETLALVLETGMHVALRRQFFGWTQGALQALIAHDILMCGVSRRGSTPAVELFSCTPLSQSFRRAACAVETGVYASLDAAWERNDRQPVAVEGTALADAGDGDASMHARHLVAHGIDSGPGYPRTLFVFCGAPNAPRATLRALALLTPYLHTTWLRVLANGASASPARDVHAHEPLTSRERQILAWLHAGRRNAEIAAALAISPNTVKNHVQKILRKMDAENRAQAVARAHSLNLFDDSHDPSRRA